MKFAFDQLSGLLPLPPDEKWTEGVWDVQPFEKNGVRLVFFAPKGVDQQSAHNEDEFYFVVKGKGLLVIGDEQFNFDAGDAFFVAAGKPHRFEQFSDDFAVWAVFF